LSNAPLALGTAGVSSGIRPQRGIQAPPLGGYGVNYPWTSAEISHIFAEPHN